MRSDQGSKGSVLIVVLWALFFLALLGMAISAYVRPQLDLAIRTLDNAKMHYLARSGVERAIFEVENDKTGDYDALRDSWSVNGAAFNGAKLGGGTVSVLRGRRSPRKREEYGLVDEERKISINKAPYGVLKNLFVMAAKLEDKDAGMMADCIIDWRDEDDSFRKDGAEEDYYSSLAKPYHCKNGAFESPEELLQVKGMTPEIFGKVKDIITIYGEGVVNINTAEMQVLQIVGLDKGTAEKIIGLRGVSLSGEESDASADAYNDPASITAALTKSGDLSGAEASELQSVIGGGLLGAQSNNFRGYSSGRLPGRARSVNIEFVYDRNDKVVKYWREE